MSTTAIRQFPNDTFSVLNEDGEAHLVAFDENAVYGLELAFPESDDDRYRVNALRLTRDAHGAELQQRLTLAEYPSHMEAEEHLAETSTALFEGGRDALPIAIREQPAEYAAGYMVASYPPDAVLTGESASVLVIAVSEHQVQDALVGWNLSPWEASHLTMVLEDAQAEGGAAALLQTAAQEALTHSMIEPEQPLFPTSPHSPLAYLDQRGELVYQAEIVQAEYSPSNAWGWHEARFAVLPDGENHPVALLDVYRDALTGDLAGEYLPLSQHPTSDEAEQARDVLIERAFDADARQVAEGVVENPVWQPMQPAHYDLYERLAGFAHEPDLPPEETLDPLLVEAMRLGAVVTDLEKEEQGMPNTLKAESLNWQVDLNEHVTHLPPYVTAEYRSPENAEGVAPVRLRTEGDESMYGLEVSSPDEAGAVRLAAIKTFDSEILHKPVTESAVLKTYHPSDYDESVSYLNPRSEALSDARALVYEWGRADLDHAMGSALLLAQENGFKGDKLFEQGPADTFAPVPDARPLETIQTEREWGRDAEIFGKDGYRIPQPDGLTHAREIGRYGVDPEMEPGQFYGVTVREAHLRTVPDPDYPPVYVVEGMKAWLEKDTNEVGSEMVTLDVRGSREASLQVADGLADGADLPSRLEHMETLAHQAATQHQGLALPLLGEAPADHLNLNLREEGLFTQGPPDPVKLTFDEEVSWDLPEMDPPGRLATPIGAYVDRHAGDYLLTDAAILPPGERLAPPDEIDYRVLPLDTLPRDQDEPHVPAEYDPVRMKPIDDGIPTDHGADYAFEVRHIRAFDLQGDLTDSYHVVEAVKSWHDPDILSESDERLTLALPLAAFDEKEPAFQTAEQLTAKWWAEGVQPAMQEAANMAAGHLRPDIMDVENGHLFGMGPADPFTVELGEQARQMQTPDLPDEKDTVVPHPFIAQNYSRTIGEAAYDLPLEEGQSYAFQARRIEELEHRVAPYGVDAMAVEAVKSWEAGDEQQQEVVTLGVYFDRDDARREVDTYVDLAEREGIQAAMSRAAVLADAQHVPQLLHEADELGIHINPDVRYGDMFSQGPDDPFLSEREINHIAAQYTEANPPQHRLSLEVLPVQDKAGQALGHSVVALDAAWDHEENSRELEDAQSVTAYELAQFQDKAAADTYALGLSEYMGKREIVNEGTDINPALDFVKGVQDANGLGDNQQWLLPYEVGCLAGGEWSLRHEPTDFQPMTVAEIGQPSPLEVVAPDLDL